MKRPIIQEEETIYVVRSEEGVGERTRTTINPTIHTFNDAKEMTEVRLRACLGEDGTDMTQSHSHDAQFRLAFYTFLPRSTMRSLFMTVCSSRENLDRVNSLFGAPPYYFLETNDASLLMATGFSHGRVRMSYDRLVLPNYNQFGAPLFTDSTGIEYGLSFEGLDVSSGETHPLHNFYDIFSDSFEMRMRIPRMSRVRRQQLRYPEVRSTVTLSASKTMLSQMPEGMSPSFLIKVLATRRDSQTASTAAARVEFVMSAN